MGVITIWPGVIYGNSRKCFLDILKDGSDGNIQLKTILKVKHDYLLKIKNSPPPGIWLSEICIPFISSHNC